MSTRTRIRLAAAAGGAMAAAAALPLAAQAATRATVLSAEVGPGFSISLKDAAGKKVKELKAGTYTIKVSDKSEVHNFRLYGPGGVNKDTGVKAKGDTTWTVTLQKGAYTFVCDPHATIMKGKVEVK